jgi:MraZ protein
MRDDMAFRGTFDYSLDAKNRLTIPAKFRTSLSQGVVLAKGIERCMQVWTPTGFEGYTDDALKDVHRLSDKWRKLTRFFSANSFDAELDSAGRVMVPGFLLEHAELRKEVVVTGAGDCLEVWDRAAWAEYNAALSEELPDITATFGNAG